MTLSCAELDCMIQLVFDSDRTYLSADRDFDRYGGGMNGRQSCTIAMPLVHYIPCSITATSHSWLSAGNLTPLQPSLRVSWCPGLSTWGPSELKHCSVAHLVLEEFGEYIRDCLGPFVLVDLQHRFDAIAC